MHRMQWDMQLYGWVKQICSFSPKAFFSLIVHFTNWMQFCAVRWTSAAFKWIMPPLPYSAYTSHLNATFPTTYSVLQPLFGSGHPRLSPRQRPGLLCTPSPTTKTKPSVFSPIIIIPTISLYLIILCSPSRRPLCPPFCISNPFFILNSTTRTNTDLYLYFLPPRPVFIAALFPSPLIHKTDPSPSWREKGEGCCHKQNKRQAGKMVKLSIHKSGKSSVLDRKCSKPRGKCRLHYKKMRKGVFENWDSRWKG